MRWRLGWTLVLVGLVLSCGTAPGGAPTIAGSTNLVSESTTALPVTTVPLTTVMTPSPVPITITPAKGALGASRQFGDATVHVVVGTCDGSASGTGFAVDDRHGSGIQRISSTFDKPLGVRATPTCSPLRACLGATSGRGDHGQLHLRGRLTRFHLLPSLSIVGERFSRSGVGEISCHPRGWIYSIRRPDIAREITMRWISDVPSKIVKILASRCQRSTGYSRE